MSRGTLPPFSGYEMEALCFSETMPNFQTAGLFEEIA
jgi:hypothetical protein